MRFWKSFISRYPVLKKVSEAKEIWEQRDLEDEGIEICTALYKQQYIYKLRERWRLYLPLWPTPDVWLSQSRWHLSTPKFSALALQVKDNDFAQLDYDTQIEVQLYRHDKFLS